MRTVEYTNKIIEVAYHNFPLVYPKETVLKAISALLEEYAYQFLPKEGEKMWDEEAVKKVAEHNLMNGRTNDHYTVPEYPKPTYIVPAKAGDNLESLKEDVLYEKIGINEMRDGKPFTRYILKETSVSTSADPNKTYYEEISIEKDGLPKKDGLYKFKFKGDYLQRGFNVTDSKTDIITHGYTHWLSPVSVIIPEREEREIAREMIKYVEANKHSFINDFEIEKIIKYTQQLSIDQELPSSNQVMGGMSAPQIIVEALQSMGNPIEKIISVSMNSQLFSYSVLLKIVDYALSQPQQEVKWPSKEEINSECDKVLSGIVGLPEEQEIVYDFKSGFSRAINWLQSRLSSTTKEKEKKG